MSDFLHFADKFKNKLGISGPKQPSQQGGYYQGPPPQSSPGGYPSASYNYQPPQFPAQYGTPPPPQPWEHQYQPPGFPSPAQYVPPQPSDGYGPPPPIPPRTGPPTIPERPISNPAPGPELVGAHGQQATSVGAIYAPGTYPTPDLFDFPLGKHTVLHSPAYGFTAKSIQHELDQLGPTSTLYLPRGSRWEVEEMITMQP
ncbi:hypothetical protein FRC12_013985, partial [Ceratobasidium sp. 428]